MASGISSLLDVNFMQLLFDLEQYGWFHFVFPFMLVFAIVFTILHNVELFKNRKPVKIIIALVFSFFAISFPITGNVDECGLNTGNYSTGSCQSLGTLLMTLLPGVTAFTFGILALYIVAAMLGVDLMSFLGNEGKDAWLRYVLGGLGLLVVIYYYAKGFGWEGFQGTWLGELFSDPLLYIIVLFGLFFWWITKDDEELGEKEEKSGE